MEGIVATDTQQMKDIAAGAKKTESGVNASEADEDKTAFAADGKGSNVRDTRRSRSTRIPAPITAASTRSPRATEAPNRYS